MLGSKEAKEKSLKVVAPAGVAEPCRFDTVPVPVPTSYFPSYGSGSGSLNYFKKN
jgi:hypothetical protein